MLVFCRESGALSSFAERWRLHSVWSSISSNSPRSGGASCLVVSSRTDLIASAVPHVTNTTCTTLLCNNIRDGFPSCRRLLIVLIKPFQQVLYIHPPWIAIDWRGCFRRGSPGSVIINGSRGGSKGWPEVLPRTSDRRRFGGGASSIPEAW